MRMIPNVAPETAHSAAERRLFGALSNLQLERYRCLHSVHLRDHLRQRMGELDFVLVGPRGVLVLEVKGGGVSCEDGVWYFQNRWGDVNSSRRSPFQQAEDGMFSLKKLLRDDGLSEGEELGLSFGYGVVFPDVDYDAGGVEWPSEVVLDEHRWRSGGLARYIHELEDYWLAKNTAAIVPATDDLLDRITALMRPDFEVVEPAHAVGDQIDSRVRRLTEGQYRTLDLALGTKRLLVQGGAGTGKTFLAAETVRREAARGQRVLFVCLSPLLAKNVRQSLHQTAGARVEALHDIMLEIVRRHGSVPRDYRPGRALVDRWFVDRLVPAFQDATALLAEEERYDVLVIDEAQDILNLAYLMALGRLLKGGLDGGTWRIFFDPFNQGAIFGNAEEGVLELLRDVATCTAPPLNVNCRNTDPIVLQTKLLTGADVGVASTGRGPAVLIRQYRSATECAELLRSWLVQLRESEIELRHVTILSPRQFQHSAAALLPEEWRRQITVREGTGVTRGETGPITFATVADYKGLENRYIALCDIEDLDSSPAALATVYVGMTRARVQLWMAVQVLAHARLSDLVSQRAASVLEDVARVR